jgi:4-amino-4-deoxy-L-arabinose transferase-like glycosyltransferase
MHGDLLRVRLLNLTAPARQRLTLLLIGGVLFLYGLGDRDLNSSHEARAAQNAQMVLSGGHWLLPRLFDGHLELQKPPLYYWLVALLGLAGGGQVGPWVVRLPAALSALGCVLFVHLICCRRGRPLAGFFAGLVLATCLHFTWLARVGRIDMPLTLATTVALGSFHLARTRSEARGASRWFFLGYTALGLGVLLKGPIALALPALVQAILWLFEGLPLRGGWRRSTLWWGIPWVLLIAAPWFIWANVETGGKLWEVFFWYHNVERGLGGSETLKAHPWWFYGPTGFIDLLPWSLALPFLLWTWCRKGIREERFDPEARLGLCWFTAILVFLSCMSFKRADYLLPAYPGFALLLACSLERWWASDPRGSMARLAAWSMGAVVGAVCLGWGWYDAWIVPRQEAGWPYQRIAAEIRSRTDRPVIFFRAESHVLAFHIGRPLDTILEWENLEWWAARPFPVYVVMPEEEARDWPKYLSTGQLEEVLRTRDWVRGRDHPMVVLRNAGAQSEQ